MATALFIAGLVITFIGVALVLFAQFKLPPETQAKGFDPGEILKQLNVLLDKIDKRFRIGVILMAVGLTLIGIGAYLEAKDAKDAVTMPPALFISITQ